MRSTDRSSRREFVRLDRAGRRRGGAGLRSRPGGPPASRPRPRSGRRARPTARGQQAVCEGQLVHPGRKPEDFAALAEGQAPLAVIVGCADSRVAPELIFDQGVGDLFVVRVAGNIVSGAGPDREGKHRVRRRRAGRQADHGAGPQSVRRGQGRHRAHRCQRRPARFDRRTDRPDPAGRPCGERPARRQARITSSRPTSRRASSGSRASIRSCASSSRTGELKVVGGSTNCAPARSRCSADRRVKATNRAGDSIVSRILSNRLPMSDVEADRFATAYPVRLSAMSS